MNMSKNRASNFFVSVKVPVQEIGCHICVDIQLVYLQILDIIILLLQKSIFVRTGFALIWVMGEKKAIDSIKPLVLRPNNYIIYFVLVISCHIKKLTSNL